MAEVTGLMEKVMMEVSLWWCWVSNPFPSRKGKKIPFGSPKIAVEDVRPPCVSWPFPAWLELLGRRAEVQAWGQQQLGHRAWPCSRIWHREGLGGPGWGRGRDHPWHPNPRWRCTRRAHGYPQASWEVQPLPAPVFSWCGFHSCIPIRCQPWSGDFLPPVACLEVATSVDEMAFSTSKVRARRVVEELNNTQVNPYLAVIANITGFHHEKGEQRKGFKWVPPPLRPPIHLIFPPFADPFN